MLCRLALRQKILKMDADVVIVGGGIVGLWTLYHLSTKGIKSVLFEQFTYPHTQGSSHGQSRATRYIYGQEEYDQMMTESFQMWNQLQDECGEEILVKSGVLKVFDMLKSNDVSKYYRNLDQMDRYGPSVDVIPGDKIEARFPGLRYNSKHKGLYNGNSGLLKADKCLEMLRKLCRKHGGVICDSEEVLGINQVNSNKVEVTTCRNSYYARSVILTCGGFTNKLLSTLNLRLPLKVMKAYVMYWKDKSPTGVYSLRSNFPSIINPNFYSIPSYEYPGYMKLCCNAIFSFNIEEGVRLTAADIEAEKDHIAKFKEQIAIELPEIDVDGPTILETCNFTKTPDWGFVIDFHPRYRNIAIGAGFSGHGFTTSPVVGKILAEMSQHQETSYSLKPFSIGRFLSAKL